MNFQGKAVLVYLEEDNIARAYFRIQPLLTEDGSVATETLAAFPDDGFLRIVPDKNEQHTFKERMRSMCGLCVLDLRALPPEANKIRTNKNYSPARGENNQFIVYSDAVHAMPEDLFFQVVAEENVAAAHTPQVYIRKGAVIQGPFRRSDVQPVGEISQLPPDSNEIHAVSLAGQELLFYWPRQSAAQPAPVPPVEKETPAMPEAVPAPAPAEEESPAPEQTAYDQIQALNATLSENANRLHVQALAPMDYVPDQPQKPLVGTRLYQAPQRPAQPRRAHNPLMEAVEQQRYAARYEAPGAVLQKSAELKEVSNPVDAFKRALEGIWRCRESQRQAVDMLLSQPGLKTMLSRAISTGETDLTLTAMHAQLQELEAERLMTLMQLDDAKKNLSAAREEALGELTAAEQQKLDQLKAAQEAAQKALEEAKAALAPVAEKRQEAVSALTAASFIGDAPILPVAPAAGTACPKAELIARVEKALKAAGFMATAADAQTLLTIYALSERMEFCGETEADAQALLEAFAGALGAPVVNGLDKEKIGLVPGGNSPVFIENLGLNGLIKSTGFTLCLTNSLRPNRYDEWADFYESAPFACVALQGALNVIPAPLSPCEAVSRESVRSEMLRESPLNQQTMDAVAALRRALAGAGRALPLTTVSALCRFIAATQNDFPGGVAEAMDRGVCALVLPHVRLYHLPVEQLLSAFAAMPRMLKALKNA